MQGIIEISSIKGNSGQGSPVFSKPGLMHNTMFKAFDKESGTRKAPPEELPPDFENWKSDLDEIANKIKFRKQLVRFERKKKNEDLLERMVKIGLSKPVVPIEDVKPEQEDEATAAAKKKPAKVALIGD